jgi:diketogulonate reductase-like aldo/keto reductase
VPLEETLKAFEALKGAGSILDFGVSNFDLSDMQEATALPGGKQIATNQVLYNLLHRGIQWDLLPWCRQHSIPIIAYSPIEHTQSEGHTMLGHPQIKLIAARHNASPAQIAIAWLLHQQVVVIPKAANPAHVRQNRAALDIHLAAADLRELDHAFPPPHKKVPLEMR